VAQAIGAIAEETSTATTGDERSEDDLDALAGGVTSIFAENTTHYTLNPTDKPVRIGPSYYDKPKVTLV
jgi:hypothetical protein